MAYDDPRLVDLYDVDNPAGADHRFYRDVADRLGAHTIIDIGCGTGILTVTFARPDRHVVGVDPSMAMLNYARRRPGSKAVTRRRAHGKRGETRSRPREQPNSDHCGNGLKSPCWDRTARSH